MLKNHWTDPQQSEKQHRHTPCKKSSKFILPKYSSYNQFEGVHKFQYEFHSN